MILLRLWPAWLNQDFWLDMQLVQGGFKTVKKKMARVFLLALFVVATLAVLTPTIEQTATAVPFCEAVGPEYPCEEYCYCTSDPHNAVVTADCCLSTAFTCS